MLCNTEKIPSELRLNKFEQSAKAMGFSEFLSITFAIEKETIGQSSFRSVVKLSLIETV